MQRVRIEDHIKDQERLQKEINRNVIKPISFEIFKKEPHVRAQLKTMQVNHKNFLKAFGYDPKKIMNVPTDREGNLVHNKKK